MPSCDRKIKKKMKIQVKLNKIVKEKAYAFQENK